PERAADHRARCRLGHRLVRAPTLIADVVGAGITVLGARRSCEIGDRRRHAAARVAIGPLGRAHGGTAFVGGFAAVVDGNVEAAAVGADVVRAGHAVVRAHVPLGDRRHDAAATIGGGIVRPAHADRALGAPALRVVRIVPARSGDAVIHRARESVRGTRDGMAPTDAVRAAVVGRARVTVVARDPTDRHVQAARDRVTEVRRARVSVVARGRRPADAYAADARPARRAEVRGAVLRHAGPTHAVRARVADRTGIAVLAGTPDGPRDTGARRADLADAGIVRCGSGADGRSGNDVDRAVTLADEGDGPSELAIQRPGAGRAHRHTWAAAAPAAERRDRLAAPRRPLPAQLRSRGTRTPHATSRTIR